MELFGFEIDKNLDDFKVIADNLDKELGGSMRSIEHSSRANAIRYLIERCKMAESKVRWLEAHERITNG